MLKKYGLGDTPKSSVSDNPMISPFMKLTLDDDKPKKLVDFKLEEDEKMEEDKKEEPEEDSEDDVFEKLTIQVNTKYS